MKHRIFLFYLFFFSFLFLPPAISAPAFSFSSQDRILVVAPHPDDETLGAGGMIQSARKAGAEVTVIYLTCGESNELSSLFYQKKPMLLKTDFIKNGRVRKREAVEAMSLLGVSGKNLFFFGYPDFGTLRIWEKYWEGGKPYRSFFTRLNKVIQEDDFSYGKYFKGYNVVHDFEKVILEERPTHIFVTAPFDRNLDHQAAYLFLSAALLNVEDRLAVKPAVHLYLVHGHDWPKPRKYDPGADLLPPLSGEKPDIAWSRYALTSEETQNKQKAILHYESQLSYARNFLLSFVRKNEIYAEDTFEDIHMQPGLSLEKWALQEGVNPSEEARYAASEKELFIEIPLIYALDEMGTLSTNVFSYKKGEPFGQMPKLRFKLFGNQLFVKDRFTPIFDPGIFLKIEKNKLLLRIPLSVLKNPEYLFVSTRTAKNRLSLDFGEWRVMRMTTGLPDTGSSRQRQVQEVS